MNLDRIVKNLYWAFSAFRTIDHLPESIIFVNSAGYITRFNKKAAQIFGLVNSEETYTKKFDSIVKDGMEHIYKSLQNAKPILASAVIPGREFYVELNVSKSYSEYIVSLRDMTKLTAEIFNEDKIAKFNSEKNAMLIKIENDIKSPLTSITGFSQGLLDGLGGDLTEKQAKYVKIINNNAEDLHHFMDKLLEFSYAESSIYQSDFHKFDIVEAFKSVIKEFENEIHSKKLAFDFDYEEIETRNIYTDKNAATRILRNIMQTALPMTDSGFILVKLTNPDELDAEKLQLNPSKKYLKITIKDTGAGIAEEDMKYLCEPYAQLEKGKKNFLRALKLGSASIFTKRANGFINISSEIMNGTKYEIILPAEKE